MANHTNPAPTAKQPYATQTTFSMDFLDFAMPDQTYVINEFEGFTFGQSWNGWGVPMFDGSVCDRLMDELGKRGFTTSFDAEHDAFTIHDNEHGDDHALDDTWVGFDAPLANGSTVRVYAIGAYSWTWDEQFVHFGAGMGGMIRCRGYCERLVNRVDTDGWCSECVDTRARDAKRLGRPIPAPVREPEHVTSSNGATDGQWTCICGNNEMANGFYPCDEHGHQIGQLVDGVWNQVLLVCDACGRIIDQNTLAVVGRVTCAVCHEHVPFVNADDGICPKCAAKVEHIKTDDGTPDGEWECVCGNITGTSAWGFYPSTPDGRAFPDDDESRWDAPHSTCDKCGRIVQRANLVVVGRAVCHKCHQQRPYINHDGLCTTCEDNASTDVPADAKAACDLCKKMIPVDELIYAPSDGSRRIAGQFDQLCPDCHYDVTGDPPDDETQLEQNIRDAEIALARAQEKLAKYHAKNS